MQHIAKKEHNEKRSEAWIVAQYNRNRLSKDWITSLEQLNKKDGGK